MRCEARFYLGHYEFISLPAQQEQVWVLLKLLPGVMALVGPCLRHPTPPVMPSPRSAFPPSCLAIPRCRAAGPPADCSAGAWLFNSISPCRWLNILFSILFSNNPAGLRWTLLAGAFHHHRFGLAWRYGPNTSCFLVLWGINWFWWERRYFFVQLLGSLTLHSALVSICHLGLVPHST